VTKVVGQYDAYLAEGRSLPHGSGGLDGKTVAIKDLLVMADGQPTTAASKILEPFVSPYVSTVVERVLAAGGTVTGKTNLDEFAMGSSNENSAYGAVDNPWDSRRVPGGSSGGSAAAVAGGLADVAVGTDTGCSVRLPASYCGIVGIKPTYGRVSRYGVIAMASSLDQVGTFGRTVTDAALLLREIAGHDPRDATSVERDVPDYLKVLDGSVEGLKIGLPKEYFVEGIQPEVEKSVRAAVEDLRQAGAEIVDISLPHTKYAIATYSIIVSAEASSNLARYDGIHYGYSVERDDNEGTAGSLEEVYYESRAAFGPEPKRRIMLGAYVLSAGYYDAYYKKAMQVRTLIKEDFDKAFRQVDVILTPTTPTTAFKKGEKVDDPLQMYLSDVLTAPTNLAGLPGISVPCGFDGQDLPIGLQLIGPAWGEEAVLRVAHAYEQTRDWHKKQPKGA